MTSSPVTLITGANRGIGLELTRQYLLDGWHVVATCRDLYKLPVVGLMCIPPVDEEPALHFALLTKMAARNGLAQISMGMSADYEMAVKLGATHVRVGSALFGSRPPLERPAEPHA